MEWERRGKTAAKTDIDEPRDAVNVDQDAQMIAHLRFAAGLAHYACAHASRREADLRKRRLEHPILLIAPAATPLAHQLLKRSRGARRAFAPKLNVQIFKRNRVGVQAMQGLQCLKVRSCDAIESNPRKIFDEGHLMGSNTFASAKRQPPDPQAWKRGPDRRSRNCDTGG